MFPIGTHLCQKVLTCQQCNIKFSYRWIQGEQEPFDKPAATICSDCMNGFPPIVKDIRVSLTKISDLVNNSPIPEVALNKIYEELEHMIKYILLCQFPKEPSSSSSIDGIS